MQTQAIPFQRAASRAAAVVVDEVSADALTTVVESLAEVFADIVNAGVSLGFVPPLSREQSSAYWRSLRAELQTGARLLLTAKVDGRLVGAGQLVLSPWPNSRHRAEVQKLFVAAACRGLGLGQRLLGALQDAALRRGRSLIHLNTRQGEPAEGFYKRLHYREGGTIPGWTLGPAGERYAHLTLFRDLRS